MITVITEDDSKHFVSKGCGYFGVGGVWKGTTGDAIYGMETGDYFIPAALQESDEAQKLKKQLEIDIDTFNHFFNRI